MAPELEQPYAVDSIGRVDIVRLINSEFGSAMPIVRAQVAMGFIHVNGILYQPEDKFFIPLEDIKGKHVNVIGPDRSWQFTFDKT